MSDGTTGFPEQDGLYQVTTSYLCAGFVVENGLVTECAPILRRNINHWITQGDYVSEFDPFASAPAADEAQSAPTPAPEPSPFDAPPADAPIAQEAPITTAPAAKSDVVSIEAPITTTIKGGADFAAPWVVTRANTVAEADALLDAEMAAYMAKVQKVAAHFAGQAPAKANVTAAPQQGRAPQGAQQAPGGAGKTCAHGDMQFRSGVSAKTGKAWKAFFCPTPKGTPGQCDAEFIR